MRICVLTQYFFPHAGGSQEYIVQLYSHLKKLDDSIEVDVICYNTDGAPAEEHYKGLNIYRVGCVQFLPGQFALPNYIEVFQLLKKLKNQHSYDFINTHTRFFDNSWWAPLAAKYLGATAILTDHCATHPTYQNRFIAGIIRLFDTVLLKTIIHSYKYITVVSESTQEFLQKFGHTSTVLVAGVDAPFITAAQPTLPGLNIPKNATVITYLGRMIPSKNPEAIVAAAQKISKDNPTAYFVFAGTGSELEKLEPLASKQIIFLGQLDHKKAAALLKNTDIFVYPSMHHEGLPFSILEAGATGCAVIATNNGGIKEIIIDGESGLFVQPTAEDIAEKITMLLQNPALQKKLGTTLQKSVLENFNWERTAQGFLHYLQTAKSTPVHSTVHAS